MKSEPNVSVIVPNYHTDEYLPKAVDSIQAQTCGNHEIILVDSSGTEKVKEIAKGSEAITYLYRDPNGVAAARNEALEKATGEYIAFLDADDYWRDDKTEQQIKAMHSTGASFVYANEYILSNGARNIHTTLPVTEPDSHYIEYFRRGTGIPIRTVLIRQSCLEDHRFWEELPVREDPHFWVRVLKNCQPYRVDEPLAFKIQREDSLTSNLDRLYSSELQSVRDLQKRLQELQSYGPERESQTHYKYGKQFLLNKRRKDARQALFRAVRKDSTNWKAILLLSISFFPISRNSMKRILIKLENRYQRKR